MKKFWPFLSDASTSYNIWPFFSSYPFIRPIDLIFYNQIGFTFTCYLGPSLILSVFIYCLKSSYFCLLPIIDVSTLMFGRDYLMFLDYSNFVGSFFCSSSIILPLDLPTKLSSDICCLIAVAETLIFYLSIWIFFGWTVKV